MLRLILIAQTRYAKTSQKAISSCTVEHKKWKQIILLQFAAKVAKSLLLFQWYVLFDYLIESSIKNVPAKNTLDERTTCVIPPYSRTRKHELLKVRNILTDTAVGTFFAEMMSIAILRLATQFQSIDCNLDHMELFSLSVSMLYSHWASNCHAFFDRFWLLLKVGSQMLHNYTHTFVIYQEL